MGRYIAARLAFVLPQVLLASIGTFALLRVLPVDPVSKFVGPFATDEAYRITQRNLGLDRSFLEQLGAFLGGLARGDLGTSWATGSPVRTELLTRFPLTLQLVAVAFVLAVLIAVPVGFFVASRSGGRVDRLVTGYSLFAGAQPEFWWGLVFVFILYFKLGWFPAPLGEISSALSPPPKVTHSIFLDSLLAGDLAVFRSALHHYVLPWLTLVFVLSGPIIKMTRQGAEAVLGSDFVLYARAAGLPRRFLRRETLRLSLAPVVTLVGILFGFMLGASVLVEFVFSFDGVGAYSVRRTLEVDFPAIQGAVVLLTTVALLIYLSMDILHALLDPRVRLR